MIALFCELIDFQLSDGIYQVINGMNRLIHCVARLMNGILRSINIIIPMNGKVGATCSPPAVSCTSGVYRLWASMIGFVGQLVARWPQVALPRRLPMGWAFPMIGLVGDTDGFSIQWPLNRLSSAAFARIT